MKQYLLKRQHAKHQARRKKWHPCVPQKTAHGPAATKGLVNEQSYTQWEPCPAVCQRNKMGEKWRKGSALKPFQSRTINTRRVDVRPRKKKVSKDEGSWKKEMLFSPCFLLSIHVSESSSQKRRCEALLVELGVGCIQSSLCRWHNPFVTKDINYAENWV